MLTGVQLGLVQALCLEWGLELALLHNIALRILDFFRGPYTMGIPKEQRDFCPDCQAAGTLCVAVFPNLALVELNKNFITGQAIG